MNCKKQYSLFSNLCFVIKQAWRIDKRVLCALFIKSPTLVILPLLTTYLTKEVIGLVEGRVQSGVLIMRVVSILACILCFWLLDNWAGAHITWRSYGNRFAYVDQLARKAMDTDYINVESPDGQLLWQKAFNAIYYSDTGIQLIFEQMAGVAADIVGLVVYSSLLFALRPWLPCFLLILSILSYLFQRKSNLWLRDNKDNWVKIERKLEYIITKAGDYSIGKDVRVYGMQGWFAHMFADFLTKRKEWYRRQERVSFGYAAVNIILLLLRDGCSYFFLVSSVLAGEITVGDFVFYFGIISQYSDWLFGAMRQLGNLQAASLSIHDFRTYMDLPDAYDSGRKCDDNESRAKGEITFKNVSFSYDKTKKVLDDMNLHINKGEKVAIVGLNGAGKTTFVKLLCGLYVPDGGHIEIDGVTTKEYARKDYYDMFSVVFQDIVCLPVSIAKNIALCEEDKIDHQKLHLALRQSGLYEKVQSLPNKEKTLLMKGIHEAGIELSGGEMQKLALARALYKNGVIVVLDEPTAALDPLAEKEMYLKYHELTGGRTSIFISHRLSSTRFCDRILLFDEGKIVEEGTHHELMEYGGKYAELFKIQSQYYQEGQNEAV